jgi:hypothetical protein
VLTEPLPSNGHILHNIKEKRMSKDRHEKGEEKTERGIAKKKF